MLDDDLLNQLRLRRLMFPSHEKIVQKNLIPLKENTFKKEIAHSKYEKNCQGRSPLLRDLDNKLPIHERLGINTPAKKRVSVLGTSTNTIIPRRNRRHRGRSLRKHLDLQQLINNMRQKKKVLADNFINPNEVFSNKMQLFNNQRAIQSNSFKRFQLQLNSLIQAEIRQIQSANPRQIFHGIHPIMPVSTSIPLNYRFTNLALLD